MTKNKYLFFLDETPEGRKTSVVAVLAARSGDRLGTIKWFGRWRQYAFFPESETIYNPECLKSICEYIEDLMATRR